MGPVERGLHAEEIGELTKMNADFDLQVRVSLQKQWGFGDWFRSIPIIHAASPSAAFSDGVTFPSLVAHSPTKIFGPFRSYLS